MTLHLSQRASFPLSKDKRYDTVLEFLNSSVTVIDLESPAQHGAFTKDIPPAFDGHNSYSVYPQDVELWLLLTSLKVHRRGPAIIGSISCEAKTSSKSLVNAVIAVTDGVENIFRDLDKSYDIETVDQLDIDLASFLYYY